MKQGRERRAMLFVEGKDPAREVWTGERLGVARARSIASASRGTPAVDRTMPASVTR
ncbi:MAG: aminopeptidase P N-terminal domain-containing protein [Gemmatimonadota bacterium]